MLDAKELANFGKDVTAGFGAAVEEIEEEYLVTYARNTFHELLDELIKGLEKENEQIQSR